MRRPRTDTDSELVIVFVIRKLTVLGYKTQYVFGGCGECMQNDARITNAECQISGERQHVVVNGERGFAGHKCGAEE